jgi:hypothetical protein
MQVPTTLFTGLLGAIVLTSLGACNAVSESLLVKNKAHLQNPPSNAIPANMQSNTIVSTPQSMTNRFSYYGLTHAENAQMQ